MVPASNEMDGANTGAQKYLRKQSPGLVKIDSKVKFGHKKNQSSTSKIEGPDNAMFEGK